MSEVDGVTTVSTPMNIGESTLAEQGSEPTQPTESVETPEVEAAPVAEPAPNVAEEATPEAPEAALEIQEAAAQNVLEAAGLDMSAFTQEYADTGELSDATYDKLTDAGFPRDLVENYVAGTKALVAQKSVMIEKAAYSVTGGQEGYGSMTQWAASNLDASQIAAFNTAVNSNDEAQINLAVRGLHAQYTQNVGNEGVQVQGNNGPVSAATDTFETKAEMASALASKEYRTSPTQRAAVEAKIARSMKAHGGSLPR